MIPSLRAVVKGAVAFGRWLAYQVEPPRDRAGVHRGQEARLTVISTKRPHVADTTAGAAQPEDTRHEHRTA